MLQIRFVDANPAIKKDRRARELEDSANRSHASTVGHRKRKRQPGTPPSDISVSTTTKREVMLSESINGEGKLIMQLPRPVLSYELFSGSSSDPFNTYPHLKLPKMVLEAQHYSEVACVRSTSPTEPSQMSKPSCGQFIELIARTRSVQR